MFLLKIPVKIILAILYPLIYFLILRQLDALSGADSRGQTTGFLAGLKSLWKW